MKTEMSEDCCSLNTCSSDKHGFFPFKQEELLIPPVAMVMWTVCAAVPVLREVRTNKWIRHKENIVVALVLDLLFRWLTKQGPTQRFLNMLSVGIPGCFHNRIKARFHFHCYLWRLSLSGLVCIWRPRFPFATVASCLLSRCKTTKGIYVKAMDDSNSVTNMTI